MKKWLRSPLGKGLTFALAILMICFGGYNVALALPAIVSRFFVGEGQMTSISTSLIESNQDHQNLKVAGWTDPSARETEVEENLIKGLTGDDPFKIGKYYDDVLTVKNDGVIPQYVRVTLYRYWQYENNGDGDGKASLNDLDFRTENGYLNAETNATEKALILDPTLIQLDLNTDDWRIVETSTNGESITLYYPKVLAPGETTPPLMKGLSVSNDAKSEIFHGTYWYNRVHLHLKARVDAVQDHNHDQALSGAWGINYDQEG